MIWKKFPSTRGGRTSLNKSHLKLNEEEKVKKNDRANDIVKEKWCEKMEELKQREWQQNWWTHIHAAGKENHEFDHLLNW